MTHFCIVKSLCLFLWLIWFYLWSFWVNVIGFSSTVWISSKKQNGNPYNNGCRSHYFVGSSLCNFKQHNSTRWQCRPQSVARNWMLLSYSWCIVEPRWSRRLKGRTTLSAIPFSQASDQQNDNKFSMKRTWPVVKWGSRCICMACFLVYYFIDSLYSTKGAIVLSVQYCVVWEGEMNKKSCPPASGILW